MWLARLFCILALVALSGLDRVAVQTYAWATMLQDRAPVMGVSQAIDSTFSGDDPCEICSSLAELTQEEQQDFPAERSAEELPKIYSPPAQRTSLLFTQNGLNQKLADLTKIHRDLCDLEIPTPPPEFS